MDYSSSTHDSDNPAGASPWGSSPAASPQHARTGSFPTTGDVPSSPTPYSSNQSGYSQDTTLGGGSYHKPEGSAGTSSVTDSDGHRPDTAESVRSPRDHQQAFAAQQQQPGPTQPQYQGQPPRPDSRGYPSAGRQQQNTFGAQYKLQTKITGLERTGRKDPILRFDVHVGRHILTLLSRYTLIY